MRTSLSVFLLIALTSAAQAQAESWKGKTVVHKGGAVAFFSEEPGGPRVFIDNLRHISYKVLDDRDNKLKLRQAGVEAWVEKDKMVSEDQAEDYFTSAIALNPHISFYYSQRAAVYYSRGDYDKALKDQDETIRLNPQEPAYFNNRGITHAARRDYDKAIQDYGEALRLKPEYTLALRNRGTSWNNKKHYDRALRDFTEALQLDPREAGAHAGLGSALAGKKQYAAALNNFENALRIDSHVVSGLNGSAWLLATCPDADFRNGAKAVRLAHQACAETDWKAPGVIDTLAAAHAEAGQFAEAVSRQEQALAHKSFADNQEARERLRLYQEHKAFRQD